MKSNRHLKLELVAALVLPLLFAGAPAAAYQAMQGPTQMLLWNKDLAFNGYTLFAAHGGTYLIDMQGNLVHSWKIGTNPKLLPDGHLLDAAKDDPSGFGGFVEVDWDGNTVWTYNESRKDYAPHHDFVRLFNKKLNAYTTMYIANRTITEAQALAVGANPKNGPYEGAQVDALVEVDMAGKVVWEWWFLDHLVQDVDPTWPNYAGAGKTVAAAPGRLDVNLPGRPLRKDWLHCNSMDYNEELDQVVVNAVMGEFFVVDHGNTFVAGDPAASIALAAGAKGDFLYRFGDPATYKQGDPPSIPENWNTCSAGHKQVGGAHDIHWIRPGLPGAGNFLIFDNGQYMFERTWQSYGVEIDPFLGANKVDAGKYVNPPDAGYNTFEPDKDTHKVKKFLSNQIVWRWGSLSPSGMSSHIGGSVQRLPNGNSLICADTEGHFVEVTPDGQLAWEYISPVVKAAAPIAVMQDGLPMTLSVFRALRVAPDDPRLAGRLLVPTGLLAPKDGTDAADATTGQDAATAEPSADASGATPDTTCSCPDSGCQARPAAESGASLMLALALAGVVWLRRRQRHVAEEEAR
ncbi:MAG: aryl-sulfate sulfotransferase [Myxococcota bacterium]